MVITYLGHEFFKVQFGDIVVAVNPISKQSKLKTTRFGADIALVSCNHPDYNGVELVENAGKEPFVIWGPGEYEIRGVSVRGFLTKRADEHALFRSVYALSLEDINLCFLTGAEEGELDAATKEALGEIDILFVPIGTDQKTASLSYKRAMTLDPGIIIPSRTDESTEALKTFLKESGAEGLKPLEKLTLRKKDLIGKEGEVLLLANA